jgi:hypothetical protein
MKKRLHWLLITREIKLVSRIISSQTSTHEVRKNLCGVSTGTKVKLILENIGWGNDQGWINLRRGKISYGEVGQKTDRPKGKKYGRDQQQAIGNERIQESVEIKVRKRHKCGQQANPHHQKDQCLKKPEAVHLIIHPAHA